MDTLKQPTNEDIKALLKKHGLTREEAGALVYVSVHTVDSWTAPSGAKQRQMPLASWELLLLKLDEHPSKALVNR